MLITISTPTLSIADKQFLTTAVKQSGADVSVVCVSDGVYAPTIESTFFEKLTNSGKEESPFSLAFVDSDASSRGAKLPDYASPITPRELAALSAKHIHWITFS